MARKKKTNSQDRRRKVLGVLLLLLALLLLTSLVTHGSLDDARITGELDRHLNPFEVQYHNQGGMMGAYLSYITTTLIGWLAYFIPLGLVLVALRLFSSKLGTKLELNSFLLFVISLLGTMIYNIHILSERSLSPLVDPAGGYVADRLTLLCLKLLGNLGSYIVLAGFILMLLILYSSITPLLSMRIGVPGGKLVKAGYMKIRRPIAAFLSMEWLGNVLPAPRETEDEDDSEEPENDFKQVLTDQITENSRPPERDEPAPAKARAARKGPKQTGVAPIKPAKPLQLESFEYAYPGQEHLTENPNPGTSVGKEELEFTARMLRETLQVFGVGIDGEISSFPGPIITRFEFKPAAGVKVHQIINLSDDLALALKAQRIRIVAPIPGKAAVGIEIPNRTPQMVYLRDIIKSEAFANPKLILPIALGMTISGKPCVADLTKAPHLLIAGATGSGKSVCMNVLITSFLYRLHPHQVRFILIDPKMLELSVYSGIPHLGRPVVTKPKRAEKVLTDAVAEMESRYRRLAEASVRNIEEYNRKQSEAEKRLPYIVIFVDELADLMMSSTSSKTELLITRLAQMSRAVGIHLILATQRPSVDVITGLIKANFPARIAFQVSSKVDSRTIIDANGAEKLLGMGDMLYLQTGRPEPVRIHGAYVSSEETDAIVKFIKDQGLAMFTLENISQGKGEPSEAEIDMGDPLFKEACEVVVRHKQGSVSLLQRRLGIGYQRAARLIDKLEQAGIVSPFDGSKARDVLVDKPFIDTLFANPRAVTTADVEQN